MIQSENIKNLLATLAEVQNELPTMPKDADGYGYKYTTLDTITQTIKPILHKHGIGYMQSVGGVAASEMVLTTRIFNKEGEYIEDTAALPVIVSSKNNAAQTLGMSITYMRRYALCAMLGITSDEDVDADVNAKMIIQQKKQTLNFEPKGGNSTPEEIARIKELTHALYANGQRIFSSDEINTYSSMRKDKTAKELIAFIENALRNRRSDAPELNKKVVGEPVTAVKG